MRLARVGTVEGLKREENVVFGADFTNSSGFNGISPFFASNAISVVPELKGL